MTSMKLIFCAVFALAFNSTVNAALISPVSGVILQGNNNDFNTTINNVNNVIDGVIDFDEFLSFRTPNTLNPIIRFDLGGRFALTGVSFWNNGGFIGGDGEGVAQFTLNLLDEGLLSITSQVFNPNDLLAQQDFTLSGTGVRFVEMTINAGNSNTRTIFHEIQFDATPVPAPGTLVLLATGLVGFVGTQRRAIAKSRQAA